MLFFVALCVFVVYFVFGLMRFYSRPVSTKVEYRATREIEFPSVTICNYNYVRKTYVEEENDPKIYLATDIVNPYSNVTINYSDPQIKEQLSSLSMITFGLDAAHLKEEMFVSCSFMSNNASANPCSFHEELLVTTKTQMGKCYTFHPQSYINKYGPLVSKKAGVQGGLTMRIDVQQEEYQVGPDAAGIKVRINNAIKNPFNSELKCSYIQ